MLTSSFISGMFLIPLVYSQTPEVTITHPTTHHGVLMANTQQSLTCRVVNRINQAVEWYFIGKNTSDSQQITRNEHVLLPQHYSVDHPSNSPESWRITIKNVRPENAGTYMCRVWTSANKDIKDTVVMDYVQKPKIDYTMSSQSATVVEGEPHELTCEAHGIPEVATIWTRLGGALLPVGGNTYTGRVLRIPSVQAEHRGNYTCTARNSYGSSSLNITLSVQFRPIVKVDRPVYKQKSGNDKQLACYVEANPVVDKSRVTWFFNDRMIEESDKYRMSFLRGANYKSTMQLYIRNVESSDYGQYKCSAVSPTDATQQRSAVAVLEQSSEGTPVGAPVLSGSLLHANLLLTLSLIVVFMLSL